MRTLTIDWPELLDAIHTSEDGELRFYLDVDTGEVVPGGDDRWTDIDDDAEDEAPEHDPDRFLHVPGKSSREAWRMRADFASTLADPLVRRELDDALEGKGAFQRFKRALEGTPGLRDAWFAYERERAVQEARDWLESVEIEPSNPPPELPAPAASTPQPALRTAHVGLTELLLLGAPNGRTELIEGVVYRQLLCDTEAEAQAIFRQVVLDAHALLGEPPPGKKAFPQAKFAIGPFILVQDARLVELKVRVRPEAVRAFWR